MKKILLLLIVFISFIFTYTSYAESIKERLRRARMEETIGKEETGIQRKTKAQTLNKNKKVRKKKLKKTGANGCQQLGSKLETCTPYTCSQPHPMFQNYVVKQTIMGFADDTCVWIQTMPNGGKMKCNLSGDMQNAVAHYLKSQTENTKSQSVSTTKIKIDFATGKSKSTSYVDGKEASNPIQTALAKGQCVISGYEKKEKIDPEELEAFWEKCEINNCIRGG